MGDSAGAQVLFCGEAERLEFFKYNIMVHERLVRSICSDILECRDDVDDAVQETMLSAWSKLDSLRNTDAARSWLCTIARHCALDMKERIRRSPVISCEAELGKRFDELITATVPGPEEQVLKHSMSELVLQAYMMLPEKYRLLLCMRFFLCMDNSEIEYIMGLGSRGRINACYKAKAALRSNLSKLMG